jgi:hypothetical protein
VALDRSGGTRAWRNQPHRRNRSKTLYHHSRCRTSIHLFLWEATQQHGPDVDLEDTWSLGPRAVFLTSCISNIEPVYGVAHVRARRSKIGDIFRLYETERIAIKTPMRSLPRNKVAVVNTVATIEGFLCTCNNMNPQKPAAPVCSTPPKILVRAARICGATSLILASVCGC